MQLDAPNTNRGRVLARWAANAPDSFAFRAVGAGFGALRLVSLKSHSAFWWFASYAGFPRT